MDAGRLYAVMKSAIYFAACLPSLFAATQLTNAEEKLDPFKMQPTPALVGQWNLSVKEAEGGGSYPSWFQVSKSSFRTLVGSYVGQFGSQRPISEVLWNAETKSFRFSVPPQWEKQLEPIVLEGSMDSPDTLVGSTKDEKGRPVTWTAKRAPELPGSHFSTLAEDTPVDLFNGKDLLGWKSRSSDGKHGWIVKDGLLINEKPGQDILTTTRFADFRLRAEFRYPAESNSGLYLRGRYEVQIEDNAGRKPDSHLIGGVYGFLTPRIIAAGKADEWQVMEITLVGREVSVILNGETVITRQSIPGITGGALDADEAAPGPILIQGDHGPVTFRKLTLTPLTKSLKKD